MTPKRSPGYHPPLSRRIHFREPVQRFLIVCEGQMTEKLYFEAFKVPKDVRNIEVHGLGRNTASLVKEAIRLKENGDYDQVWCIFDVEDHSAQNIHAAYELARNNQIEIACSNQAFEIWFLLHFNYYNTALDRKQYGKILSSLLGTPYSKDRDLYALLATIQETAIRNARRLLSEYNAFDPAMDNPSTTVHLLVEQLNRFSSDSRVK